MEEQVDLDYVHCRVMSALAKLDEDSKLADQLTVRHFGRIDRVQDALEVGARFLREPFHDEDWDVVERAFGRLSGNPPSNRIDECCRDLLRRMSEARSG